MSFVRSSSWVFFLGVVACGGAVSTLDDAGKDGSSDGSDGSLPRQCPASPPTAATSCTFDALECEYGTNPAPSCNEHFVCTSGKWVNQTSGTFCPPQSDCPASYAEVPANQDCTPNTLACAYPEGQCICTTSFGGLQKQTPAWNCMPKVDGCPSPRPDIGASCAGSMHCDYGACSGGVGLECIDGVWQQAQQLCPG